MKSKLKKIALATLVVMLGVAGGVAGANLAQEGQPESGGQSEASRAAIASSQPRETEYVPVNPCRVADTRATTPIAPNTVRNFDAKGNLSSQGGAAGGCGIPNNATAIAVNITAVDPAGTGYLRGQKWGVTMPNATLLNYSTALNASNGVILPICNNWNNGFVQLLCGSEFKLGAHTNATDVVVDVVGYLALPIFINVDDTDITGNSLESGEMVRVRSRSGFGNVTATGSTGHYTISTPVDLRGCTVQAVVSTTDDVDDIFWWGTTAHVTELDSDSIDVWVEHDGTGIYDEFSVTAEC